MSRSDDKGIKAPLSAAFAAPEAANPEAGSGPGRIRITLCAASQLTSIRLLDARFAPVTLDANAGIAKVDVTPGIYEAGFKVGDGWSTQTIVVTGEEPSYVVKQAVSEDESVAGLAPADFTPHLEIPIAAGSVVFSITGRSEQFAPSERVEILLIGEADDVVRAAVADAGLVSTWTFQASAGHWRLRIDMPGSSEPCEVPLTLVDGFRLMIAAQAGDIDGCWQIDYGTIRIRMEADAPAAPGDLAQRAALEETALGALQAGEQFYGRAIRDLVAELANDKAGNPMLGLLACHLAAGTSDPEMMRFRRQALDRLVVLLDHRAVQHPDLAVLRLQLRIAEGNPIDALRPIPFPPMLAASWRLMLELCRSYPSLIPVDCLTDRIADRLWSSPLWVLWTGTPLASHDPAPSVAKAGVGPAADAIAPVQPVAIETPDISAAHAAQLPLPEQEFDVQLGQVAASLGEIETRDWLRDALAMSDGDGGGVAWDADRGLTAAEVAIASAIHPIASTEQHQELASRIGEALGRGSAPISPAGLGLALGLPDTTIMRSMRSLADKLGSIGKQDK